MSEVDDLLSQLRPLHAPSVSSMPAPGWWLLAVVVLVLGYCLYRLFRRRQRFAWQREARRELESLRAGIGDVPVAQTLSSTSRLARRIVLAARMREDVAGLEGDAWLDELDRICGKPLFKDGFGKLLQAGPYQPNPQYGNDDVHALLDVVGQLIDAAGKARVKQLQV